MGEQEVLLSNQVEAGQEGSDSIVDPYLRMKDGLMEGRSSCGELWPIEVGIILANIVEVVDILLENCSDDDWNTGKDGVVEAEIYADVEAGSAVCLIEAVEELRESEHHVLEKKIFYHVGDTHVIPAAVHEQQPPKCFELGKGVVAGLHGAHALVAVYAYSKVGVGYHLHVIGTVPNGQSPFMKYVPSHSDHRSLVGRCYPAAHYRIAQLKHFVEHWVLNSGRQSQAFNNEGDVGRAPFKGYGFLVGLK